MTTTCPTPNSLRNYAVGSCEDKLADEIEQHLALCPSCEETLAEFDDTNDSLLRHLPLAGAEAESDVVQPAWLDELRHGSPELMERKRERNAPAEAPQVLDELSAYELLGVLGRGGMGVVYRARHRQLNRIVAVKVVNPRLISAAEARRRFEREIRILGSLHHPGIVMATDAGRIGDAAYLVMELIDGIDLQRLVTGGGPLSIDEACEVGRQIAEALAAAHQAGAIHRDVKPSNAMLDRQGRVKLLDFGLAHVVPLSADQDTSLGRLLGTLNYMAPEQADGESEIDTRSDLFGLGGNLFFLLTGRPPTGSDERKTLLEQLRNLAVCDPPRVASLRADVPAELDELIAALLARDPANRPNSATNVAEQLSQFAGGDLRARLVDENLIENSRDSLDASAEVHESLSQLLGVDFGEVAKPSMRKLRGSRSVIGWITALVAIAGIIYLGITIFLQTNTGTLRIESDIAGIGVEVVDEDDVPIAEMQIERDGSETTLRAGKYRVRLKGDYDNLAFDRDTIALRRGEESIARIVRIQKPPATKSAPEEDATAERIFEGEPESVWRQRFRSEISPAAKINAAKALIALSSDLPAEEHIDRLLEVFGELASAGWGDDHLQLALDPKHERPNAPRWVGSEGATAAWRDLSSRLVTNLRQIPSDVLAKCLSGVVASGEPLEVTTAAFLIQWAIFYVMGDEDPAFGVLCLKRLGVPPDQVGRRFLSVLLRARFYHLGEPDQKTEIEQAMMRLGAYIAADNSIPHEHLVTDHWLELVRSTPRNPRTIPIEHRVVAKLVLRRLYSLPGPTIREYFTSSWTNNEFPYSTAVFDDLRKRSACFLNGWTDVANRELAKDVENGDAEDEKRLLRSLDRFHRSRLPDDDWDVARTAELLSERLRRYYESDNDDGDREDGDFTPEVETLLTQIVRITGDIPDFVLNNRPRSPFVSARLEHFEKTIAETKSQLEFSRQADDFGGLIKSAPFHCLTAIVRNQNETLGSLSTTYFIEAIDEPTHYYPPKEVPPIDPLLMLAILAELSGESEQQDIRISAPLLQPHPRRMVTRHIDDILSADTAMKPIARRLLQKIADRAKADNLRQAVHQLDPTIESAGGSPESSRDSRKR